MVQNLWFGHGTLVGGRERKDEVQEEAAGMKGIASNNYSAYESELIGKQWV